MELIGIWLSPLLLLPGAGLLILSTSARYHQIHDEIHHIMEHQSEQTKLTAEHLLKRSVLFRNSLLMLYSSVSIFAIAGLLGGITSGWGDISSVVTVALTIIGIFCLIIASVILMKESVLSLDIIKEHITEIKKG